MYFVERYIADGKNDLILTVPNSPGFAQALELVCSPEDGVTYAENDDGTISVRYLGCANLFTVDEINAALYDLQNV